MASTTLSFSCASLSSTLKLPPHHQSQHQNPLLPNLPLSNKHFLSPPILSPKPLFTLLPVSAYKGPKRDRKRGPKFGTVPEGDDEEEDDKFVIERDAFSRPKLEDVLPEEIKIPEPGTPEYDAILEKILPKKKPPPPREEIFAVVMVGGRQYIVIPGRWIYTQRLKGANVNDKVVLNKVLLVGTKTSTYIGKPVVTNAAVHAVVEEQLLDDKVIVFKYKAKKNYRRNIGHRQPITRIKITGITGFEEYPASTMEEAEAVSS